MTSEQKERYNQLCFQIEEKQNELENLRTDIFIFNPEIGELISELISLEREKKALEDLKND